MIRSVYRSVKLSARNDGFVLTSQVPAKQTPVPPALVIQGLKATRSFVKLPRGRTYTVASSVEALSTSPDGKVKFSRMVENYQCVQIDAPLFTFCHASQCRRSGTDREGDSRNGLRRIEFLTALLEEKSR